MGAFHLTKSSGLKFQVFRVMNYVTLLSGYYDLATLRGRPKIPK